MSSAQEESCGQEPVLGKQSQVNMDQSVLDSLFFKHDMSQCIVDSNLLLLPVTLIQKPVNIVYI